MHHKKRYYQQSKCSHSLSFIKQKSKEWFEEDNVFKTRLEESRALAKEKEKQIKSKAKKLPEGKATGVYKPRPVNNWITPNVSKKKPERKKVEKPTGSNVFAAMMDSD